MGGGLFSRAPGSPLRSSIPRRSNSCAAAGRAFLLKQAKPPRYPLPIAPRTSRSSWRARPGTIPFFCRRGGIRAVSRSKSDCVAALVFCVLAGGGADCMSADAGNKSQPYPAHPVRFIVPFPPAGGTDIVGRVIGQKLNEKLGQPFIIDNRGGAAGTLGAAIAAKAPADGYTIMLATASFAISANFYAQLPYDSLRDFAAVSRIASGPLLFVVHPSVPARSIKELIALAKANPGKLNYASGGDGGINHLPAEMFNHMAGVRLVHIPYKGAGPALAALLGGEVQLMIATLGSCLPHVRSGKLRELAVAG